MLRVGLTGGIASGKSTVARMMAERGAQVLDADMVVRDLMQPGRPVYQQVVQHFGREIVNPDGEINRKRLADAVFPTGRVRELNSIVHPAVIESQDQWMAEVERRDPQGMAVVEAALILEAGAKAHFDKIVVVTAPLNQRAERFAKRFKVSHDAARAEVERRCRAQMPDEEKIKFADYVIANSGDLAGLEKQVQQVFSQLQGEAKARKLRGRKQI
jgi:dephospho-CoA kinase